MSLHPDPTDAMTIAAAAHDAAIEGRAITGGGTLSSRRRRNNGSAQASGRAIRGGWHCRDCAPCPACQVGGDPAETGL
jgi:hypothetical protein